MRPMPNDRLEGLRQIALEFEMFGESPVGTPNGVFAARRKGDIIRMIASDGEGWEHVSVSLANRCPTWAEMCFVKDLFWLPTECVMQLHPPEADHVNNHPFCLHLWRPVAADIPRPPALFVGVRSIGTMKV
jgi:hypothetical protein